MLLRMLPLLAGILPLIAVFGAFWLGVVNDVLPFCVPFIDGCVSISATGRKPPGSFLFRAIMLPQAPLLIAVWYCTVLWLRSLNRELHRGTAIAILLSGLVAALALAMYVTFLGTKEPLYEFMRRIGIYFGFLGLVLAQLFTAVSLFRHKTGTRQGRLGALANWMLALCLATLGIGVLNVILKAIFADDTAIENRLEWIAATLMQCYFLVMFFAWRETGFSASIQTRNGGPEIGLR